MLKHACMDMGTNYCHRIISALCVGDTMIVVTLATIAVCEALLISFVWRAWQTRERGRTVALQPRPYVIPSHRPGSANLDASPS